MFGETTDSMEDLFPVLAAILEQTPKRGKKQPPVSADEIRSVDMKRLLMRPAVRNALFDITARAGGTTPDVIRGLDLPSAIAVTVATINANMAFFLHFAQLAGARQS
ncbi:MULTISPECIES: hypothetical protein [unclassified Caballeronia]|uniref:hypothetical protein n=1 Tax=unclassified Caballeronia TaxID=2646786 RepID=UPI00285C30AC|nr:MULTISPECIES: hypothetical protein [unclassified Caballeronia]MDR5750201.1 hypothetical protein [Caballeronia sp. LZ024]MDR5842670.1 hypothetical protein [Caballeronia sp. LZ031]